MNARVMRGPFGQDIREVRSWAKDGGKRVEVVVDPNWLIDGKPRVIRHVAWRRCMTCKRYHFSQDIAKVRMCDECKNVKTDKSSYG